MIYTEVMGHFGRSLEDQNADSGGLDYEVSERNRTWLRNEL